MLEKAITVREAAEEAGVSAPTLSRVERGLHLPERTNLLKLARWAGLRIDPVLHSQMTRVRNMVVHEPSASTLEAVELHLRADKNLGREEADALAEMFRVAYTALSNKGPSGGAKGKKTR